MRIQLFLLLNIVCTKHQVSSLSVNQRALESYTIPKTWVPIASVDELDPNRPSPIKFLNQKYVTYQDNNDHWVVMDDVCPHRLAPLSEGRIDRDKNVIQCSYHGWEFGSDGTCSCIPQVTSDVQEKAIKNTQSQVYSYPTAVERNVLWVWPWLEDPLTVAGDESVHPEGIMKDLPTSFATYTRDVPYGWDSLVENLIDPAHVPFAHHGMQGKRTDAIPINMTMVGETTEKGFQFEYADRTMGMTRRGIGQFRAPYLVNYNATFDTPDARPFLLSALCIPTQPGWSRVIVLTKRSDEKPKTLLAKIFSILPPFLMHQLSNRFLDSDLAFLHYQERNAASGHKYYIPSPADRCIAAYRKWIPTYTNNVVSPDTLPPEMTPSVLFDRYTQHTSHCRHCQDGLKGIKKWRRTCYGILTLSVLGIRKFWMARLSTLLCLSMLRVFSKLEKTMKVGGFKHYENH
mmetsp:Transcript_28498/g.41613  ORF Transcript_28498/g.41613 Transcript_28498/m.41613 type:complete len:458 (+) Transcript_28498:166-1539(+)